MHTPVNPRSARVAAAVAAGALFLAACGAGSGDGTEASLSAVNAAAVADATTSTTQPAPTTTPDTEAEVDAEELEDEGAADSECETDEHDADADEAEDGEESEDADELDDADESDDEGEFEDEGAQDEEFEDGEEPEGDGTEGEDLDDGDDSDEFADDDEERDGEDADGDDAEGDDECEPADDGVEGDLDDESEDGDIDGESEDGDTDDDRDDADEESEDGDSDEADGSASILAIGDSIFDWNVEENASIPDVIGASLDRTVQNAAVGGAHLSSNSGGDDIRAQYAEARGNYDWVVFDGGGNDISDDCGCGLCDDVGEQLISADGRSGDIPELARQMVADGAKVMFVGYYQLPAGSEWAEADCNDEIAELNRRGAAMADALDGVWFTNPADVVTGSDTAAFADDLLHPSVQGSRIVGEHIARAIATAEG